MYDFSNVEVSNNLTKEFVISNVPVRNIFKYYFGEFRIGGIYSSPFRKDKNPSFGFVISKEGEIFARDFGSKETWDCIRFVSCLFNVSYKDALNKICIDFNIDGAKNIFVNDFLKKEIISAPIIKKRKIIQIEPRDFTKEDLKYFKQFYITKQELIDNNVYSWENAWVDKKILYNSEPLRFAFKEENKELNETYFKLYQPYSEKTKWVSNIDIDRPFGINDLPHKSDTLIIGKAAKDRILLKQFFTDVIATQNESDNAVQQCIPISKEYKYTILLWDADPPGVTACKSVTNKYGWQYFNTPKHVYIEHGIKDICDYAKAFGLKALEKRFKENKLI